MSRRIAGATTPSARYADLLGDGPARPRLAPGVRWLIVLGMLLYVVPIAARLPLIDPDEGLHAAIAQDMVDRGDFLVPRVMGEPFLDKPILFFFAQAVSIAAFGSNEVAVRLPGHAFGLLGAVTTGWLAGACAGPQVGVVAAAVHATLAFPLVLNQAAVHDVALVPWTNLAVLCFVLLLRRAHDWRGVLAWSVAAGGCLGFAMLTKGLAGVALVGLPVTILAVLERRLSLRVLIGGTLALAIAGATAVPWYLAVERAQPGYLRYFFVERHLLGFVTTTQLHGHRDWWYYLPIVVAGSVPWVMTLPAVWRGRIALDSRLAFLRRLGTVWLAADLLFLSLAGSKLATYVLPLYPAVAILVALAWVAAPRRDGDAPAPFFARPVVGHAIAGALVFPAACAWAATLAGVSPPASAWVAAVLVAATWSTIAWCAPGWPLRRAFLASLLAVGAGLVLAYATLFAAVAQRFTARDLATHYNRVGDLPPQLWLVDERIGSVLFYLDPPLRRTVSPERVQSASFSRALLLGAAVEGAVIALPDTTVRRLAPRMALDAVRYVRAGRYRLYDAAALRRTPPRAAVAR